MSMSRRTVFRLTVLGMARWLAPGRAAGREDPAHAQEVRSYGVDVGLVRLSVTARTAAGELAHDLGAQQFQVFEEGVKQEVLRFGHHETPISVVVLFDKSASMRDEKLMHAKDAVVNFVRAFRPQDEILIIAFSDEIDVLGDFGLDARTIEDATKRIRVEGGTRLYDATIEGARVIAGPGRKEKRALLILSDGEDTKSFATLDQTAEAVRRAGIPVYAIGIETDVGDPPAWNEPARGRIDGAPLGRDPLWRRPGHAPPTASEEASGAIRALTRLTEGTGGWTYPIVAAKRCKELCIRVAEELRHQYLLGYSPTSLTADGAWRHVEVRTQRTDIVLSTRAGYYSGRR